LTRKSREHGDYTTRRGVSQSIGNGRIWRCNSRIVTLSSRGGGVRP